MARHAGACPTCRTVVFVWIDVCERAPRLSTKPGSPKADCSSDSNHSIDIDGQDPTVEAMNERPRWDRQPSTWRAPSLGCPAEIQR